MNYKNKVHETDTEIIWEIEEVVQLEKNGIYNTTHLAESIIATAYLNDDKEVLVRYLYKEKKPEVVTGVNSVTIEYATNYGTKKLIYKDIDKKSLSITHELSPYVMNSTEIRFSYGFTEGE
jgi:hypothetical protein